jgi:hypothetical protein
MTIGRLARAFAWMPVLLACSSSSFDERRPWEVPGKGQLRFGPASRADDGWLAEITLPGRADAETLVRDRASGMRVGIRLDKARPEAAVLSGGAVVYRRGGPHAGDIVQKPTRAGAEDFVTIPKRPAAEEVVYRADVGAAAGLRLVANVLELLDDTGTPRLRMAAPYVVDRRGVRRDAAVTLDDCAADRSGEGPWGRTVTPPGKKECAVRVAWSGSPALEYPVVLDPSWTATKGNMVVARRGHTATKLSNGTVLIAGGAAAAGSLLSAELFDPKTGTFAATGSMTDGRAEHASLLLKNGRAVVTGGTGGSGALSSTEVYEAGAFRLVGALHTQRRQAALTLLGSGELLVAGGIDGTEKVTDSAETFDPVMEGWTAAPPMSNKRLGLYLATLANNGSGLAVAGISTMTVADLATCEIYTAPTRKWAATGLLSEARYAFGGATLSDGRVLVSSGYSATKAMCTEGAELYDPNARTWSKAGKLSTARTEHTLTALAGNNAVAVGGVVRNATRVITSYLKSAEIYDSKSNAWSALADLKEPRVAHTATLLDDGRVLVAGGDSGKGALATAEVLTLDATGAACKLGASCASGFCAEGVCCESACATACNACDKASTGKADGTCAVVLAGNDPRGDCKDDGAPACKKNGFCDGAGACEDYASSACSANPCAENDDCTSGFCADEVCCDKACGGDCEACTKAKKGAGVDGTCGPVAKGTDPDADCGTLGSGVCKGTGTCDGASACKASTTGKDCAPAECSDAVTVAKAAKCNASGECDPDTLDCTPFVCDSKAIACTTTCAKDADCAPGAHCLGDACVKSATGAKCAEAVECMSGNCVDGYCCDKACKGQCEACDGDGTAGSCKPVIGAPKNGRPGCDGTGPCAGTCGGALPDMCIYPHSDMACEDDASCTDGTETRSRCNGSGLCVPTPRPCAPYVCDDQTCKTSCKTSDDCRGGAPCKDGSCMPGGSATCAGDVLVEVDGMEKSCAPYHCTDGACGTSCTHDGECASGAKCNADRCEAPESSGCDCELGGPPPRGGALTAVLAALFAATARRRAQSRSRARKTEKRGNPR